MAEHTHDAQPADARAGAGPNDAGEPAPDAHHVLHVDIDAFFAAIEQQRDPRLRGQPVIVGAGVIASCSYEARAFGLKAGMSLSEAKRLCPKAVILEGHTQVYRCFAEEIFARCRLVAPAVETYLDEAYCDLSGTERLHRDLLAAAARLKRDIFDATGLTVTCGLGRIACSPSSWARRSSPTASPASRRVTPRRSSPICRWTSSRASATRTRRRSAR